MASFLSRALLAFLGIAAVDAASFASDEPTGLRAQAASTAAQSSDDPSRSKSVIDLAQRRVWRRKLLHTPKPAKGCFAATYPKVAWRAVPCGIPSGKMYPPRPGGSSPDTVGGSGSDFLAEPTNHIAEAEGSFDSVTGVTSETNNAGSANSYSLQLNTNHIATQTCNGAPDAACQGFEQFVLSSSGDGHIQYWLLNFGPSGSTCPAPRGAHCSAGTVSNDGWCPATPPGFTDMECVRNAEKSISLSSKQINALGNLRLAGTAGAPGGADSIMVVDGDTVKSASGVNAFPDLAAQWSDAEFNVFGDSNGDGANFNSGSNIVVRIETDDGSRKAPACNLLSSFTAETNNLTLIGAPTKLLESGQPSVVFEESNPANGTMGSCSPFDSLSLVWTLSGNTSEFGQIDDGRPFWVGNFDGQGGDDILFYTPKDKNWWLGRFASDGTLSWTLAANTVGFGQIHDGRPFWVGNFDGQGGDDILFYTPKDKNWWLGRFASDGTLSWTLAANTAGFGQVADGRPFWAGNFDGQGGDDILFYSPSDMNWWLGRFDINGNLTWNLAGNTAGFGQVADGRPFWVGKFDGSRRDSILFYSPSDKNWWLGRCNGSLSWSLAGNTAGFGQVADGRPFWVGNFDGHGADDILFYSPSDMNWWLGRFRNTGVLSWTLGNNIWGTGRFSGPGVQSWTLSGNTAGFGQVADGRPFWVGNFDGQRRDDILFYFPGDNNWWLGRFDPDGNLNWVLQGNSAEFGQITDKKAIWVGNFDGQGADEVLIYSPADKNWWLGHSAP